jgi:diguanylate cyclase (GGDEF)-like protein
MRFLQERDQATKTQIARSAAAMYAGATFLGLSQALTSEGPSSSVLPGLFALVIVFALLVRGPQLPIGALAVLGPLGAAMIGVAVATSPGPGDGAVLYIWPVIWVAYFFGGTATILIVGWIGIVQAVALIALPEASSYLDRWFDVVVPIGVVAAVVHQLARRNHELLAKASAEARIDELTGLLNRRGFDERAPAEIARAERDGATVAAVSFDIDYFKRINDEWGHDAGDRVLSGLGDVFRRESRETDIVARMGGEEFTVMLWAADRDEAREFAERVRASFAGTDFGVGPLTISAGVSCHQPPELELDALLQEADSALYSAKAAGRDRSVVHAGSTVSPAHRLGDQPSPTSLLAR